MYVRTLYFVKTSNEFFGIQQSVKYEVLTNKGFYPDWAGFKQVNPRDLVSVETSQSRDGLETY